MSGDQGIVFVDTDEQDALLVPQQSQFVPQRVVRLNQPSQVRQIPQTTVVRPRSMGVSRTTLICCIILIILVVIGVIIGAFFLQGITNRDKSGCTESHYDNYKRGFGIDDGSCFFNQRKNDKKIKTCPEIRSFYYDVGGRNGNYTPEEWENVIVNATTTFVLHDDDDEPDKELCFTINEFDVENNDDDDDDCDNASLSILGTDGQDGTYCNGNPPPLDTLICADSEDKLDFTWFSDGTTNATGWDIEFECGVVGCTIEGSQNFNPDATIDDDSCIILPLTIDDENIIELCPENPLFFYDSGGPSNNYSLNEISLTQFQSSDPDKVLKFTYEEFDVGTTNFFCSEASLLISYGNTDSNDFVRRCNGNTAPTPGDNFQQLPGKITKFIFLSANISTADGWKIRIECETPPPPPPTPPPIII